MPPWPPPGRPALRDFPSHSCVVTWARVTQREKLGITTNGPTLVVTDLALLQPEPGSNELVVTSLHPGVTTEEIRAKTGWPVRFSPDLGQTPAPTDTELTVLRELHERTNRAHQKAADR